MRVKYFGVNFYDTATFHSLTQRDGQLDEHGSGVIKVSCICVSCSSLSCLHCGTSQQFDCRRFTSPQLNLSRRKQLATSKVRFDYQRTARHECHPHGRTQVPNAQLLQFAGEDRARNSLPYVVQILPHPTLFPPGLPTTIPRISSQAQSATFVA